MTNQAIDNINNFEAFCHFTIKYQETDLRKYSIEAMEYRVKLIRSGGFDGGYLDGIVDGLNYLQKTSPVL